MSKYIISDPDILGGTPVIKGTRVPIGRILFLLKDGYTLEAIQEDYPHIDIETISAAIDEAIDALNTSPSCQKRFINSTRSSAPAERGHKQRNAGAKRSASWSGGVGHAKREGRKTRTCERKL